MLNDPCSSNGGLRRASERLSRTEGAAALDFRQYVEGAEDYDDIFVDDKPSSDVDSISSLKLETRLSNTSWLGEDFDEVDPFAAIDEVFDREELDATTALKRDKHARLRVMVAELVEELHPNASDVLLSDVCEQLVRLGRDCTLPAWRLTLLSTPL